jgi:hypothetical protein
VEQTEWGDRPSGDLKWIIGERTFQMNTQMKNILLAGIIVLLLAACAPAADAASTPAPIMTENPVEGAPVPVGGLAPEKYSQYVGLNYPPLPAGLTEEMGMLIEGVNNYSFSLLSDGENKMLWFSKLTHYDENGNAYWQVRDILAVSDLEAGLTLIPDGCLLNGVPDHEVLVAGKDGTIQSAWRANTTLDIFEVIPTEGIECHSDKPMEL